MKRSLNTEDNIENKRIELEKLEEYNDDFRTNLVERILCVYDADKHVDEIKNLILIIEKYKIADPSPFKDEKKHELIEEIDHHDDAEELFENELFIGKYFKFDLLRNLIDSGVDINNYKSYAGEIITRIYYLADNFSLTSYRAAFLNFICASDNKPILFNSVPKFYSNISNYKNIIINKNLLRTLIETTDVNILLCILKYNFCSDRLLVQMSKKNYKHLFEYSDVLKESCAGDNEIWDDIFLYANLRRKIKEKYEKEFPALVTMGSQKYILFNFATQVQATPWLPSEISNKISQTLADITDREVDYRKRAYDAIN